ncbi:vegetative cell wall protein gp1-like [Humulus lupulus]|uniref:vegetative cell wall protein gp1-like n=1 Tax=Humulus lupulus TaxID=3486 RepID=UPI002B4020E2|nr:vegetative cell wall protein gp1-like [Humulus lupulus]
MGRVKSTAQKKKPSKPSENQPAPHAEIPSTSGRAENMPAERDFDLYAKSKNKKKSHKRQSGEGCGNPSTKKSRTEDPPMPTPTKETTPPPAPARDATPPFPVNPDPPSPVGQTPPPAPANLTPPTSTVQQPAGHREEASGDNLTGMALNSAKDRLSRITKHHHNREAIQETGSMVVD